MAVGRTRNFDRTEFATVNIYSYAMINDKRIGYVGALCPAKLTLHLAVAKFEVAYFSATSG